MLNKGNGFGLAGGISVNEKNKSDKYLDYVLQAHKKLNPNITEISRYVGIKNEITFKNQPRGYLYHIVNSGDGIWSLIPGKFTLAFSMAPEFYRQVYNKNPRKYFKTLNTTKQSESVISNTVWQDTYNKWIKNNGINKIT